ncbi:MAG: hypothetical protein QNK31_09560 [Porticoccus sp.]|nr:hypothetical protein [Porticoccus sp.]
MRSNSDKQIDARVKEIISNLGHQSATVASEKNIDTQKQKRQEQHALSAIPSHVRSTHIGRVACPLHIIELTKNINKITAYSGARATYIACGATLKKSNAIAASKKTTII